MAGSDPLVAFVADRLSPGRGPPRGPGEAVSAVNRAAAEDPGSLGDAVASAVRDLGAPVVSTRRQAGAELVAVADVVPTFLADAVGPDLVAYVGVDHVDPYARSVLATVAEHWHGTATGPTDRERTRADREAAIGRLATRLSECSRGESDVERRRRIVQFAHWIARANPRDFGPAADALVDRLDDPDPTVRRYAVGTLYLAGRNRHLEPVAAIDRLVELTEDPVPETRADALGLLGALVVVSEELVREEVDEFADAVAAHLRDDDHAVRLFATQALEAAFGWSFHLDDDRIADVLTGVADCLTAADPLLVERAAGILTDRFLVAPPADPLIESLVDAQGSSVEDARDAAADVLVDLANDDPDALTTAVHGLCDFVPVEDRWAGDYWMRQLLKQWIAERPGTVASAIESHDGTPPELSRLARRIRSAGQ